MKATNGLILLISAKQDEIWPSHTMADKITESLEQANFSHPYQHIALPGGHYSFTRETQNQVNQFLTRTLVKQCQWPGFTIGLRTGPPFVTNRLFRSVR